MMNIFLRVAIGIFFTLSVYAGDNSGLSERKIVKKSEVSEPNLPAECWLRILRYAIDDEIDDRYKFIVILSRTCKDFDNYVRVYLDPFSPWPEREYGNFVEFLRDTNLALDDLEKKLRNEEWLFDLMRSHNDAFINSYYYAVNLDKFQTEMSLLESHCQGYLNEKNGAYSIPKKNNLKIETKSFIEKNRINIRRAYIMLKMLYNLSYDVTAGKQYTNIIGFVSLFVPDFCKFIINNPAERQKKAQLAEIFYDQHIDMLSFRLPLLDTWFNLLEEYCEKNFGLKLNDLSELNVNEQGISEKLEDLLILLHSFRYHLYPKIIKYFYYVNQWLKTFEVIFNVYHKIDPKKSLEWMGRMVKACEDILRWRKKFVPNENSSSEIVCFLNVIEYMFTFNNKYLEDSNNSLKYAKYFVDLSNEFNLLSSTIVSTVDIELRTLKQNYRNHLAYVIMRLVLDENRDENADEISKYIGDLTNFNNNKKISPLCKIKILIFLGSHYNISGKKDEADKCIEFAKQRFEKLKDKNKLIDDIEEFLSQYDKKGKSQNIKDSMESADISKNIKVD